MKFVDPMDHKVKIKVSEKTDKYLHLAKQLQNAVGNDGGGESIAFSAFRKVYK